MALTRDAFIEALRLRYDYYSARAVATEVLENAGAAGDETSLSDEVVATACALLARTPGHEAVLAALGHAPAPPEPAPAQPDAAPNPARPEPADVKPAEEKPAPKKPAEVPVTFAVKGAPAPAGGGVIVVGNLPGLGAWRPAEGLALEADGEVFRGSLAVTPGTTLEFKFVTVAQEGEGQETWEGGENRALVVGDEPATVDTAWQP